MSTIADDLVIYDQLEQGSDEWVAARCGMVTASTIGLLITEGQPDADTVACPKEECLAPSGLPCVGVKGNDLKTYHGERKQALSPILVPAQTDTARGLITTLAAERLTGHVWPVRMTEDMFRGQEEEPLARDKYAEVRGVQVDEVGFMVRNIGGVTLGFSPDGLVGEDGLIEIKSRRGKKHIQTVLSDTVPPENMAQIQAGLLVSGRSWCDYVSYCGGMAFWTTRVHPDPAWFEAITATLAHAEDAITTITSAYERATDGLPVTERTPEYGDIR